MMELQIMLHSARRLAICVCVFGGWKSGCQQHQVDQLHFIIFFSFCFFEMLSSPFHNCCTTVAQLAVSSAANSANCKAAVVVLSHLNKTCNSVKPKSWRKDNTGASPRDPAGHLDCALQDLATVLTACSIH